MKELSIIQATLKAPKSLRNTFGGYNYRSCESILEAVKPLLLEQACKLILTDQIVNVGTRYYVEATATIINNQGETASAKAFAREEETKKGMDAAQITGAASSYARKYALNGLFCIDDTKDPDTDEYHKRTHPDEKQQQDGNPIERTPPMQQQPKKRITNTMLDDAVMCDSLLNWAYQRWTAANYDTAFDAGTTLLKSYDADEEVVKRYRSLFESYKIARQSKK